MAKLLVQESSGVREFELVDNEIQIGRELDNVLRLADPSISRHHAMVRRTATGYEIQDLGSSNGVLLNGAKIQSSPLQDGDRVTLGQIQMTFVDPRPVQAAVEPNSPLGTVRFNPEEMRRVQGAQEISLAEPAPFTPPPVQPRTPPEAQATAIPGRAVGAEAPAENPVPGFLQGWLPPVPDDAEPIMVGDVPERGDFVTRLLAFLIDAAPLIALSFVVMILNSMLFLSHGLFGCLMPFVWLVFSIGGLAYYWFFMPWCLSKCGATFGKKMMKLRVVPEDDPYGRIEFGTALLRQIGHIPNGCLFYLPYLMILGAERKGIQDIISKSICIKVDR